MFFNDLIIKEMLMKIILLIWNSFLTSFLYSVDQMTIPPQHLSIILTTSPIKSHPNTYIIDCAIESILKQPSLQLIHIYIICDGAKISPHDQNKYKSGIISQQAYDKYLIFKKVLKQKYAKNQQKFTILERQYRCGFAENIKYVMENYAKTDHVMIYQHDYVVEKQIPFDQVVQMMRKYKKEINYVSFMNASYTSLIPKMESVPKIRAFLLKLLNKPQNYNFIANIKEFTIQITQYFKQKFSMPLLPLNFWYDKLHIASRQFYLNVVFNPNGNYDPNRGKNMKTVTFVQDTFGHCMKWTIQQNPETLINYWGAYILWDSKAVFYHQSGRTFITQETRQGLKIPQQRSQSSDQEIEIHDFQKILTLQNA